MKPNLESKLCKTCNKTKPLSSFYKRGDHDSYRSSCKNCMCNKNAERWLSNPEFREKGKARNRRWQRQNFYGLSFTDEILLREYQNNECPLCKVKFKTDSDYHVDHCHQTNKIRGLLCPSCNKALGLFKDDPNTLRRAATYVESKGIKIPDETKSG